MSGWVGERDCSGCRFWSQMIARAGGGTTNPAGDIEALCLGTGPNNGKYMTAEQTCSAFARNTHGSVDEPPDYGETARAEYDQQAAMMHPNGKPKYAADGTMLDDKGNRSIFDDVDL